MKANVLKYAHKTENNHIEKNSEKTGQISISTIFFSHFALNGLIMSVTNRDKISDNPSFHYASVRFVPISQCFHG